MKLLQFYLKGSNLCLKQFFSFLLFLTFFSLSFFPNHSKPSPKKQVRVSISQVIDHPALNATTKGIIDGLEKAGFCVGDNLILDVEVAEGKPSIALQIAQKFVGNHADVLVGVGTTTSQALAMASKNLDIPIVFATVTDPVGAKLVNPRKPITGVSNLTDLEPQFNLFRKLVPKLKRLGIVYNPGEANSQSLLQQSIDVGKKMGIEIISSPATKTSEVSTAARQLIGHVEAIFINNDNTALAAFQTVVKVGEDNKVPVFVSDTDLVPQGAVAALGPNQYDLGLQAAQLVVKILEGADARKLPFEYAQKLEEKINPKAAHKIGIKLQQKDS